MLEDSAMEDFAGLGCTSDKPNAVVVGTAPSKFDYEHMNTAFKYVGIVMPLLLNKLETISKIPAKHSYLH